MFYIKLFFSFYYPISLLINCNYIKKEENCLKYLVLIKFNNNIVVTSYLSNAVLLRCNVYQMK